MSTRKKDQRGHKTIRVSQENSSGLSAFVERPVPTEKEVAGFERVVEKEIRQQEIESHLAEIYRDRNGNLIDVKKVAVKRRRFWRRFSRPFLWLVFALALGYGVYIYFSPTSDISALAVTVSAPENIQAGQPFSYQVNYHNPTKFALSQVRLEMQYPQGFVLASSSLAPESGNYGWKLPDLAPGERASITISGQLISLPDSVNVAKARLSYLPGTFSVQYTKEASASTIVTGPGFDIDLQANETAFLNQPNNLSLVFSNIQNNFLGAFNLSFALPSEATAGLGTTTSAQATSSLTVNKVGGQSWQILGLVPGLTRQEIPLVYSLSQKSASSTVIVRLEKQLDDGQSYVFWEKAVNPELVSSDLNLTMLLNDSPDNGALNFGQTLHYTLRYSNHGSNTFRDVAIMASLNGDFLDWSSLQTDSGGLTNSNALVWTKQDIPGLAQVSPGDSGEINFTVKLKSFSPSDLGKELSVTSYAQYSVNNQAVRGEGNKSNTITSVINSDLSLGEKIRYFDEDNTPVGSGPLPPKVGQTTSVRVFWVLKNNLHELSDASVKLVLPPYVSFDNKVSAGAGSLSYDASTRQVTWYIGRLPVSVYQVEAAFNIAITPTENDRNKILVLSPGATAYAIDGQTKTPITSSTGPKTTKLEDDDIAGLSNSGIVQ